MPFIPSETAPTFELPHASFTGLAAPSRGATETSTWIVTLHPGAPGLPHRVTREEIFVCIEGRGLAALGDGTHEMTPGSALVVPAGALFALSNPGTQSFRAVAMLPVGGQACMDGEQPFTPPWAA